MKWCVNETAGCYNNQILKLMPGKMTQMVNKMTRYWNYCLMKWCVYELTSYLNDPILKLMHIGMMC